MPVVSVHSKPIADRQHALTRKEVAAGAIFQRLCGGAIQIHLEHCEIGLRRRAHQSCGHDPAIGYTNVGEHGTLNDMRTRDTMALISPRKNSDPELLGTISAAAARDQRAAVRS